MSNRHQELTSPEKTATALASPKQTAIGKDYSNPLMAGSLPKTILCVNLSVEATTDDNGEVQITATIDGLSKTITEASLRRHLKLDDHDGITSIPNSEIFKQLALMGYHTNLDKNGYLRKGRKTKPKRQNRTRNGKAWKRQSQDQAQVSKSQPKSTPTNPEVNK
ncbi:hypothetical protein Tco_0703779 [Tanacetum coccineum]|uniref:30S ribosomal protein S13 n=1 Tax=Tanacetum coccineum TaxID=301880 RepID=A0ABQ4Y1R7_9ASTR